MTDEAISPLRRRTIEDMTIRKLAPNNRTHKALKTLKQDCPAGFGCRHDDGNPRRGTFPYNPDRDRLR